MNRHTWALIILAATVVSPLPGRSATNLPPELWFPVGEELVYRMTWGFVPIGKSRIKSEWVVENGEHILHIRYRTRTNAVFNRIYPMNDEAEVFIDPGSFRPLRFVFRKARRKTLCDETVTFDYEQGTATVISRCDKEEQSFPLETNSTDIVTFMYGMRRHPIKAGLNVSRTVMSTEGPLSLDLEVTESEDVKLPVFGKVPCVKVVPEIDLKSMLVEKGQLTLWVSKDKRRVATRLMVKAPLANVHTTLCHIHGPGEDSWTVAMKTKGDKADCSVGGNVGEEL